MLSQRFDFDLGCDPFDVYRVLRQVNPSPYMFFLRQAGVSVVGASPEPMVQLLDGRVVSRPIAGTRRRGSSETEDRRLEAELVEHPKELAEHVMLVDLARNDVGRVVRFGTERVDELMTVERYSHVMHLTSEVSGELREGLGPVDVLRATLPAGTVSGAPKVRAMEIIDELEPTKRGPYAGIVGYIDFSGNLDTAIAIRTLVATAGRQGVGAGRRRHRRRQRPGRRGRGVRRQGRRRAGRGGRCPPARVRAPGGGSLSTRGSTWQRSYGLIRRRRVRSRPSRDAVVVRGPGRPQLAPGSGQPGPCAARGRQARPRPSCSRRRAR